MFSFLQRKKVNLSSIQIPDFGWQKSKEDASIVQWINPEQTIAISVNFYGFPPDIPTIQDLELLRNFYRTAIASVNGGLIQVDLLQVGSINTVRTIFKIPQEPSGVTYLASLTFPFEDCSFVVKVQCAETGVTGMRDSMVANELMANGELTIDENGFADWFSDPYDPDFPDGILMNKSEHASYDAEFPNHPLTQARIIIGQLENGVIFSPEIEKLRQLKK